MVDLPLTEIDPPPTPPSAGTRVPAKRIAAGFAVIVVLGIIGYAIAGTNFADSRVSRADRALKTVVSHQNGLNTTFRDFDTKFNALGSSSDPAQTRTLIEQFVAKAQAAVSSVSQDDASLVSASTSLNERPWLTLLNRPSLDGEATRIAHARKALAAARTAAVDYAIDGQFLLAYLDTTTDQATLVRQYGSGDYAAAQATLTTMKTDVDHALQLSIAQGLPAELHDLMVDFQAMTADLEKLLAAHSAGDSARASTLHKVVDNDLTKIASYKLEKVASEIDAYFKKLIDGYNSEMAAATAP